MTTTTSVPTVTVTCPGSVTYACSLVATGNDATDADRAWQNLQVSMPPATVIADFVQAVASSVPSCPGTDCNHSVREEPRAGFSVSTWQDPTTRLTHYQYRWSFIITVVVTCSAKTPPTLTPGRPALPAGPGGEGHGMVPGDKGDFVVFMGSDSPLAAGLRRALEAFLGRS